MANSLRHKRLLSRVKSLENNLLPTVKVSGNYTKKESDLIRSYILLSHAEIESYFEDIAKDKVSKALNKWIANKEKSNCLLSVMSFCGNDLDWQNKPDKDRIESRINRTISHYINLLQNNHGIKSKNILNILLPLGVELDDIDQAWLSSMNTFGAKRGVFAHSTIRTQSQIDLVTEKNFINNTVLPEIVNLDDLVKKIK